MRRAVSAVADLLVIIIPFIPLCRPRCVSNETTQQRWRGNVRA